MKTIDNRIKGALRLAVKAPGGYYVQRDGILPDMHRLGLVTHKRQPSRLTSKGELVREVVIRYREVDLDSLQVDKT